MLACVSLFTPFILSLYLKLPAASHASFPQGGVLLLNSSVAI